MEDFQSINWIYNLYYEITVVTNLSCSHKSWFNNIDEAVKANANLIKELIDVRDGDKCVPILDMQDIMSIIQELCVA